MTFGEQHVPRPRLRRLVGAALLAFALLGAIAASSARAVTDEEEFNRFGGVGSAAGQLYIPRGVATDPETGAVYVADSANNRISKFDAWGVFLEAWGWGVLDGQSKLQHCVSTCQAGIEGSGPGQLKQGSAVAVDGSGDVYIWDLNNHRIQKFNSAGEFVLMIGGEVNKTTGKNLCTKESGNECGVGIEGSGPGEFATKVGLAHLAVDQSGGKVFFADNERIQVFEPTGIFESEISFPGKTIRALAFDSVKNDFYVAYAGKANVERLGLNGELLDTLPVPTPNAVAVDPSSNVYVIDTSVHGGDPTQEHNQRVLEFDGTGQQVSSCCVAEQAPEEPVFELDLTGIGTNTVGDVYVAAARASEAAYVTVYGPPPTKFGLPPEVPPTITSQFVAAADSQSATLRAAINPHFWQDATYYVEYGTGKCSEGGCPAKQPVPPAALTSKVTSKPVTSGAVALSDLQESTLYHFRFVSESGGGGPVFGIDPDGEGPEEASVEDGLEGSFKTFPKEDVLLPCPNDGFRTGASALLPDCRAYEMVSPVDKANGDIVALIDVTGYENRLNQSSTSGEALTHSTYRAFGDTKGASYTSQYLARRGAGGWNSESLAEPRGSGGFYTVRLSGENEYKAFSADLCKAWLVKEAEPQLAPEAVGGFPNVYRRGNCPKSYEAVTTVEPPNVPTENYVPEPQGYSADGTKAIFRVNDNLTVDAPAQPAACATEEQCLWRVYEASGGKLSLVCILPNGTPFAGNCSAGSPPTAEETSFNRTASVHHAISEDGSRIYWSASAQPKLPGKIYLRLNGETTLPVSEAQGEGNTTKPALFFGASADGSKALFEVEDPGPPPLSAKNKNLYLYDLGEEEAKPIAGKVIGVSGASEDLSYVYFISEEAIGGKGTAGKANLYLSHEGTTTFIATLSSEDVRLATGTRLPSDATAEPVYHAAQVSPDGRRLAFISTKPLTGFDNTDAVSGESDSEVFTYAADTETLDCVSCSPAGASPVGRIVQATANEGFLWTAASIPTGENQLYTPRVISEDGNRVFFTSYADLLPRDKNGKADVYEWERAGSSESCKGESDPGFYAANGGCLFLISSGQSTQDSEFVDSSPTGNDVFFGTAESLLTQDPDLIDIYDARIEGGFSPIPPPAPICEGEDCLKPSPSPPGFAAPPSEGIHPGNPPLKKPIKCPKGKHRVIKGGKERCAKNKSKAHKHKGKKKATKHKSGRQGR
jgi:DNA-binding beta-propeller fold protein YncE